MRVILAKAVTEQQIPQFKDIVIKKILLTHTNKYDDTEKIIWHLADFQSRVILFSIIKEGKTAEEVAYSAKLPLSSVYKKLGDLEELALVQIERRNISDNGRKFKVYRSRIAAASINMKSLKIKISLFPNHHYD